MLPVRRAGTWTLRQRQSRAMCPHQLRLACRQNTNMSTSTEDTARITSILHIRGAISSSTPKLTLLSLKTDDQRRDYLWKRRAVIQKLLPGRSWPKIYAMARRLWEFNYLRLSEKDLRKILENGSEILLKLEETPPWLKGEIKQLEEMENDGKKDSKDSSPTSGPSKVSLPSSGEFSAKEVQSKSNEVVDTEVKGMDQDGVAEEDLDDGSIASSPLIFRDVNSKQLEKDDESSAVEFLEKKATESTIYPVITPDFNRIVRRGGIEEEATVERLNLVMTPDDTPSAVISSLQKLSRVLTSENVRPDLKPVYYPNQATFAILTEATSLLEEACFAYVKARAPVVTTWPSFDCPEAQEYKRWVDVIVKLGKQHSKDGLKLPVKFSEGSSNGDIIRNAAAHRLPIHAPKIRELLRRSGQWVRSLGVPEIAEKFDRLETSAASMQADLEAALQPIADEVMGGLEKMQGRLDEIRRLENQILEIQKLIRKEKSKIEEEETKMKETLRKGQAVRYEHGQNFEKEKLRLYVHGTLVQEAEKVETEEVPVELEAPTKVEELPVELENLDGESSSIIEVGADGSASVRTAANEVAISKDNGKDKKQRDGKKSLTLDVEEVNEMLAAEDSRFSETDRTRLARDYQGGLVAYEKDTLLHIEDISDLKSKLREGKKKDLSKTRAESLSKEKNIKETEFKGSEVTKASAKAGSTKSKKAKESGFEGSNLSKDSDIGSMKGDGPKWYNPMSWFG